MTAQSEPLKALAGLRTGRWVDLTHSFHPGSPHCPSFKPERRVIVYDHAPRPGTHGSGFLTHEYRHVGQWGTHVDPPAPFVPGLRYQDQIPATEMVLPLVILDVHQQAASNPDYVITPADLADWESRHGPVPEREYGAVIVASWPKAQNGSGYPARAFAVCP
jgi:kynurenine formamidase